jgi:CO/xanthine dehydrogenase Mo-binding subunit
MGRDEGDERRRLVLQLAAEGDVDPRTVERWLDGKSGNRTIDRAIEAAARKLGLRVADLRQINTEGKHHG